MDRQTTLELSPLASNRSTAVAAHGSEERVQRPVSLVHQRIANVSMQDATATADTVPPSNAGPSNVLNLAEAAALVRCSRAHLSNVINGKVHGIPRLPAVRIGRRVVFRRESLESWLQQVESMAPFPHSR